MKYRLLYNLLFLTPLCGVSFHLESLPPLQNSQVIQSYHPPFRLFFCCQPSGHIIKQQDIPI